MIIKFSRLTLSRVGSFFFLSRMINSLERIIYEEEAIREKIGRTLLCLSTKHMTACQTEREKKAQNKNEINKGSQISHERLPGRAHFYLLMFIIFFHHAREWKSC